jgi:hypothetical protein
MVCPPKGVKVDLHNQPLTMTTRLLPTADAFAHKSAHYRVLMNINTPLFSYPSLLF